MLQVRDIIARTTRRPAPPRVLASPPVDSWSLLFSALGLAVFLEGLPYFVSPAGTRRALEQMGKLGDGAMRLVGLVLMVLGLLVAYVSLH